MASDLALIPQLRKQNPNLNVLLSVGGWGARGFSGAAATKEPSWCLSARRRRLLKYGLDGIDLDWEYPVNGAWGLVASTPADRDNFTFLLKELRAAFGQKNWSRLRLGPMRKVRWVDVKAIAPFSTIST